ncbi:hypothetical protein BGZ96_011506 [Linnemannia gamsii]|uniref:Uncharacterized protein n=1 Tax=Linnemannia gamsii TaxID=64522 RepID=A0ABQ7KB90_9FUNG|nr:hypothetical protein BGZ96_011506 [Linnemannia gamsii]
MWSVKDKQDERQRPPTPRWDPSVAVSPNASLLHQRRSNPKFGRTLPPKLTENDNHLQKTPPPSSTDMQNFTTSSHQQDHPQDSPSTTSPLLTRTEHLAALQARTTTLQQFQQLDQIHTTTVDPRRVSFLTEPYHTEEDNTLLAIHPLPQLPFAQPTPRTRELTPPTSLLSLAFSPSLLPWNSHAVSPFPHRSLSELSDHLAAGSHTANEIDSHSDSGSGSSRSTRIIRPELTGGICPRTGFGGKSLALPRPSRLSFVETAGSSEDQSSSAQTPVSKFHSPRGSTSGRGGAAYPGSSSSSSTIVSAGSTSATLSPLSDEHRTEMDAQIHRYNLNNEHRVRYIMDERLPTIFKSCDILVRSMLEDPRWISVISGPVHDFGRLPAREFKKTHVSASGQPLKIMTETLHHDNRDGIQRSAVVSSKVDRVMDIDQSKSDAHLEDIKEEEEGTPVERQTACDEHDKVNTPPSTKRSHQVVVNSNKQDPSFVSSSGPVSPLLKTLGPQSPPRKTSTEVSPLPKSTDSAQPLLKPSEPICPSFKAPCLENISVKPVIEEPPPFVTTFFHDSDLKLSPHHSNSSQGASSGESTASGQKRKREDGSSSELLKSTRTNVSPQLCGSGAHGRRAAPGSRANVGPGHTVTSHEHQVAIVASSSTSIMQYSSTSGRQLAEKVDPGGPINKKQSLPSSLLEKERPSLKSPYAGYMSSRAKTVKLDAELSRCMHSFLDCCVQLLIYLQRPAQIASLSEHNDAFDYAPSTMSTPIHYSNRSGVPETPTPPNFPHAPLSVKMKLKEELKKLIKGGNDVFIAMEKYHAERADLLSKMHARKHGSDGHAFAEGGSGMAIEGKEQDDDALAQLELCLELLDMRHSSTVRYGALELQSSCAALYQMLRTVFA